MAALAPDLQLADRYLLVELVAAGGMATVWRARDRVLDRTVAIKVLREDLAQDEGLAERFHREAVAAARLTHPHVVSVFDSGSDGDLRYLVMEYVRGRSFREVVAEQSPMEPEPVAAVMVQVLDALAFAHALGVVHRDIKPGNILMGDDGRVKVADFGIAKVAFQTSNLTTTGALLGTVRYISPEQVQGLPVDGRSDLYSAGVVMYEALAGRPPFEAGGEVATALVRLTHDPPPLRSIRAEIPEGVEAVVTTAMALHPDDRFRSAQAMAEALEPWSAPPGRAATPLAPERPTRAGGSAGVPVRPFLHRDEGRRVGRVRSAFRTWILVPLIILALAAAVIGIGLWFGRLQLGGPPGGHGTPSSGASGAANTLAIAMARDFDPQGDGSENPQEVPLAIDGNASTSWSTDHYDTADFGRLKQGVGLWIGLSGRDRVVEIVIRTPLSGWAFQLKAGTLTSYSAPLPAQDGTVTFVADATGATTIRLEPVTTSGILIWITRLAPDQGRYAAAVAEVSVRGFGA